MRSLLLTALAFGLISAVASTGKLPLICYWESWSVYRNAPYKGNASAVPVDKCTHIIYTFLGLDQATNKLRFLDPWQDIDSGGIKRFVAQKQLQPDLKVTFAIGGWNEGSDRYSKMASSAAGRETFAASVAEVISQHGFDGVDLDWEYPGARGGDPSRDKANFVLLLQAMRKAIGDSKLLTVAVSANDNTLDTSYDVPAISKIVDFIHVMTYDLRGPWESTVDNHVLLHMRSSDSRERAHLNVAGGMKAWKSRGAPASKLIMGFAFYGKSFTLTDPSNNAIGAPAKGPGRSGPLSQTEGTLFYFEICGYLHNDEWTSKWDDEGDVPYAFNGDQWVGFDDEKGIEYKVEHIRANGYGGAMVWAVNNDDIAGLCGEAIKYPLLTTLRRELDKEDDPHDDSESTSVSSNVTITPCTVTPLPVTTDSNTQQPSTGPSSTGPPDTSTKRISSTASIDTTTTLPPSWRRHCTSPTYPHEESCRKFYLCDDSGYFRLIEMDCGPGLVFNEDAGVCDWSFNTYPSPPNCADFY